MKAKLTVRALITLCMIASVAVHRVNAQTAPSFTTQPLSCSSPPGIPISLFVSTTGSTPQSYQWTLNGSPINNATNTSYTTAPITSNDLGTYSVVASNSVGAVTSSNAVVTFGPVACWGTSGAASSPPPNLTNVAAIASASQFSCSLQTDGSIVTWGTTTAPTLTNAVAISASSATIPDMGLALLTDGTVVGWGGATVPPDATNIIAISAGESSLFLRNDGTVLSSPGSAPAGLANIVAISAGLLQDLALRSDGTVVAWNPFAEKTAATNVPPNLRNVVGIGSGFDHGLALTSDGHVAAWRGTLASTNATNIPPYLTTNVAPQVVAIAAGGSSAGSTAGTSSSIALLSNGTVIAWGDGLVTNVPPALTNVAAVAAGAGPCLALVNDGRPLLLQPPVGGSFYKGRTARLSARATGNLPLTYQWLFNGTNLPDATNCTLELPNFDAVNAGTYQLIVTNATGTATTLPVPLGLLDGPLYVSSQPASSTNYLGRRVHLGGAVNGSRPIQLQWRYSPSSPPVWQDLPGATNEDLVFDPFCATNAGVYSFVATNAFGSVTSSNAIITARQLLFWGSGALNISSNLTNVTAISAAVYDYCLALRSDGTPQPCGINTNFPASVSNLVEVACNNPVMYGLRKDGTAVEWYQGTLVSNVMYGLSNIVSIETDKNGSFSALSWDGRLTYIDSLGHVVTAAPTNIIAIGSLGGSGPYYLYSDGRVAGTPSTSNAVAVAGGLSYQTVLRRDGTIISFGKTNAPTSNIVSVAGTGAGTLLAVKSDGTIMNWAIPSLVSSNIPNDLYAPAAMSGGNSMVVAMFASTPFPSMLLNQALDIDATVVSSDGSAKWFAQTNISHDGQHAARSAEIGRNTASSMRMFITNGPVTVSFWWKVSSETNNDTLTFSIAGVPQASISGEVDWQQVSFTTPPGLQMLIWTYSKDAAGTAGLDAGFVDQLSITPIAPTITGQPQSQTISQNTATTLTVTATGTPPFTYQWLFDGTNIAGATDSSFTIASAQVGNAGSYSVVISNVANSVTSSVFVVTVDSCTIHVTNTSSDTNNNISIIWSTDPGITYTVQSKSDLTNAQWTTLAVSNAAANTLPFTDVLTNSQQFYRLISDCTTSEPCGFLRLDLPANSDTIVSTPFVRPVAGAATVQSVASNTISVIEQFPAQWTLNQFVYSAGTQPNNYYARFISGAAQGPIYPIISNDTSTLIIDTSSATLSAAAPGDHLLIEPYSTPNSIFPNGTGINISPTVGNRNTEVLSPDLIGTGINLSASAIYFFNAGIWKQVGQGGADHGDDIIPPNSWFIVRHNVPTNTTVILSGIADTSLSTFPLRTSISAQQDNAVSLWRPTPVTLDSSGLITSGAFTSSPLPGSRTDELLTFDNSLITKNKSASSVYYYWSNAWRRVGFGNADVGADNVFSPGTGVIIRKAATSTPAIWTNTPPY